MAAGLISCSKTQVPDPAQEKSTNQAQPQIEDPIDISKSDNIVLAANDIRITLDEYRLCVAGYRLRGNELSDRALANPRFQRDELQRCYQTAFMRKFAEDEKAQIRPAIAQKIIRTAFEKYGVQSEDALAQKLEITTDELQKIAQDAALPMAIQEHLAMTMADDEAQKKFNNDFRRLTFELADFDNKPTDEEAEHFEHEEATKLSVYISQHTDKLQTPPHANFVRMQYKAGDDANEKIQELSKIAKEKGMDDAIKWCQDKQEDGCSVLNDKSSLYRVVRTDDIAWAFRAPAGEVSRPIQTENGVEIWILSHVTAPEKRNAQDHDVRHEMAILAMQSLEPAPHVIEPLKAAIEVPSPDFQAITVSHQGIYKRYDDVLYMDLVSQKTVTVQPVLKLLSSVTQNEKLLFSSPMLDNGHLYILRVLELNEPTDEDFKAQQNVWRSRLASDASLSLVDTWIEEAMPRMTSINVMPIEKKYGILQPDGKIHK